MYKCQFKKCILYFQTVHRFLKKAPPATVVVIAVERYTSTAIVVTIIIIIAPLQLLKDHVVEDVCLDISCGYYGRHFLI